MGSPILLGSYALVAEIAEVWLGSLQIFPGSGMDGMAVIAGNPFVFVPGHVPEGQVSLFAMTGKAFGRLGLGIGEFFAENEDAHTSLAAFLHVSRPRAMAGLAAILAGRATGNTFFGVRGEHVGFEVVLVAARADLHPDRTIASFGFLSNETSPQEEKKGRNGKEEQDFSPHTPLLLKWEIEPGCQGIPTPPATSIF